MWASESIPQVLLFLLSVRELFPTLAFAIYDNACAVVRHMRKKLRVAPPAPEGAGWKWLSQLQWVIDRLHFTYHKSCRDPASPYYVAGVRASDYPVLQGVDTEGAEQIFSVARRWQATLSQTHPVHEELLLLICGWDHNRRHTCSHAAQVYRVAQAGGGPPPREWRYASSSRAAEPDLCAEVEDGASGLVPGHRRRKKVRVACGEGAEAPQSAGSGRPSTDPAVADAPEPSRERDHMSKRQMGSTYVWVNTRSKTVHHAVLPDSVSTGCGYYFGQDVRPQALAEAELAGHFTCGTCYGWRAAILDGGCEVGTS